ncbi:MAG: SMP-30/gluconolactonase/LRE family protein [Proteobacteria bacterium]|nr:SMP-30/gluconolactonase/LRE family protein [Pseudomonadota bacterium]
MKYSTEVLVEGLVFPEGPRWRDGKLWFSDMNAQRVMTVDLAGTLETIAVVPQSPSGLGWLPDGRLLVVSMADRRLLRLEADGLKEVANLWELASHHCNDMVVDGQGRAYIGNFGFDLGTGEAVKPAEMIMVTPDGEARVVADELLFPNGAVITPDGKTLIVGETYGARLTAFDIEGDGSLTNRRVWASVEGVAPDGICLDAEGAVWVADPAGSGVLRVREGDEITDRIAMKAKTYACMLGGTEGRTLFILTSEPPDPSAGRFTQNGRIETVEVEVAHAGLP